MWSYTLRRFVAVLLIAVVIAVPLGLWAGSRPNSWIDNLGSTFGFLGISMPSFWLGIVFILVFAGIFHLLPSSGRDSYGIADDNPITGMYLVDALIRLDPEQIRDALSHLVMPATVLGINMVGMLMR